MKQILCFKEEDLLPIGVHSGRGTNNVVCTKCGTITSDHVAVMTISGVKCPNCAATIIDNDDRDVWEASLDYKDHHIQFVHVRWLGHDTRITNVLVDGRTKWYNIPFRYRVYAALLMHEYDGFSMDDANRALDNAGY